jgi:hypothetical protein
MDHARDGLLGGAAESGFADELKPVEAGQER